MQTVVVELLDRAADHGDERWTVSVYDELHDQATGLITGPTARRLIAEVRWPEL